jgi:hypothetical protein
MIDKYLEHLIQKLNEQIRNLEESLGGGAAKDYAEYQNVCGQIKGLLSMRYEISDLKQRLENSDE